MPRALKDLLIACCLTLASVVVGVALAGSARAEPARTWPDDIVHEEPSRHALVIVPAKGRLGARSRTGTPPLAPMGTGLFER